MSHIWKVCSREILIKSFLASKTGWKQRHGSLIQMKVSYLIPLWKELGSIWISHSSKEPKTSNTISILSIFFKESINIFFRFVILDKFFITTVECWLNVDGSKSTNTTQDQGLMTDSKTNERRVQPLKGSLKIASVYLQLEWHRGPLAKFALKHAKRFNANNHWVKIHVAYMYTTPKTVPSDTHTVPMLWHKCQKSFFIIPFIKCIRMETFSPQNWRFLNIMEVSMRAQKIRTSANKLNQDCFL